MSFEGGQTAADDADASDEHAEGENDDSDFFLDPPQSPKPKCKATPHGENSDVNVDVKGVQQRVFATRRSLHLVYSSENVSSFVKLCQAY